MDNKSLFGTSGIRGSADTLFTPQFCFDIGRTFGVFLKNNKQGGGVAIGMDPRGSSPKIKENVIYGLLHEGFEVFDEGATPVPAMCFLLQTTDYITASIMVTGSHIKANLNGVKFFAFNEEIYKNHEAEIDKIYLEIKNKIKIISSKAEVTLETKAVDEYKKMLLDLGGKGYPSWRVVVDPGDGAQSDVMPFVLKSLGIDVVEMNCTIQGEFFARDTENFDDYEDLMKRVVSEKADFGIGFDSDGDRCIFIDKAGNFIPGDYTATLIARETNDKKVVTTLAASQVVDHIGKEVIRTIVGAPHILKAMKDNHARFGFEPNGGGVSAEIMYTRDGGSTVIKLLNILRDKKLSLEEAVSTLPKFYISKAKVDYKWEQKDKIISEAKKHFKGQRLDERDGLKIWQDGTTWILFRSSQNAPEFRVFVESPEKEKSEKLLKEGLELVRKLI